MKLNKERGGFSISFGGGAINKLTNKASAIQSDLNKWQEVVDFMNRRANEGDVIAEKWVKEISAELQKGTENVVKTMSLPKKMFTEKNRLAVNDTIQRNFKLENFISTAEWENRTFDISII